MFSYFVAQLRFEGFAYGIPKCRYVPLVSDTLPFIQFIPDIFVFMLSLFLTLWGMNITFKWNHVISHLDLIYNIIHLYFIFYHKTVFIISFTKLICDETVMLYVTQYFVINYQFYYNMNINKNVKYWITINSSTEIMVLVLLMRCRCLKMTIFQLMAHGPNSKKF